MNRDIKVITEEFNKLCAELHNAMPRKGKKEEIKCLPLKILNKWYLENGEMPELDDYFRTRNVSWDSLSHRDKQRMYNIVNE